MSPITRGVEKFGKIPYHTIGANLTLIEQSTQEKRPVQSVPYFSQILSLTWGPPHTNRSRYLRFEHLAPVDQCSFTPVALPGS
jgi:hypothetical protein